MSDNWIVQNLERALEVWNEKLAEIWMIITQSPENFKGGSIWSVITSIHGALQAIGYALLVLFFVIGVMRTCGSFAEVKKPEHAVKLFIRFAIAKGVITYGLELMMAFLSIIQGIISTIMNSAGFGTATTTVLPTEIVTAIEDCGFFESIPLWAVTLIGGLFVWVLSFVMILSVYGRFFKLYMYTAIAPIPLSTFAGEPTQNVGKSFLKSYAGVCLEGAIIVLACIIFSVFASSPPVVDYQNRIETIKANNPYDDLEMSGSRAVWPQVLSIYAVKTTTDPDNAMEVATMTEEKKQLLTDIFWTMNDISYRTETRTETEIVESDDGNGNILEEEVEVTHTTLYIVVTHKDADSMASQYNFSADQNEQLEELLAADNSMWLAVLYGIYGSDDMIVQIALTQIGNVGGEPYWSWYGFSSRVEWCACFVSWCADQCGYIENGIIPKYAGCVTGVNWFKQRNQWADNSIEPTPGMIIFFDWDNKGGSGPQDGLSDHTGIVERVENGIVYTVEGNTSDSCAERHYSVGYYEILGYGIPAY